MPEAARSRMTEGTSDEAVRPVRIARRLPWRRHARATAAKRRVQGTLLVLLVLLASVLGTGIYAAVDLYQSAQSRYVDVVIPLRTATRDIVLQMVNEETGTRGYMITTDRASLAPYFSGREGVVTDLAQIARLTRTQPELATRLRQLQSEIRALHGYYSRLITFVADGQVGQQRARAEVLNGQKLFGRFRATSAAMQADIDDFFQQTRARQRRTFATSVATLGIAGFFALAIAGTLLFSVPERLRLLYAAEEDARVRAEQGANAARALEHVSEAVLLVDEENRVRSWNQAAERLFGLPSILAIGRRAADVVPGFAQLVESTRRPNALVPVTVASEERWLAAALNAFEGGAVLTLRDATAAHALERSQADFVATASHELRTPLTGVYGGVRTLLGRYESLGDDERVQLLQLIERESTRLSQIVDQLLVTAQVDGHRLRFSESRCDLIALCNEVVDAARLRASDPVSLLLDLPEEIEPLLCDESLLRQILVNLVENAIKYSPDGGPITVHLREAVGWVRIEVEDEGLGVPASEHERIFDKFYRLDPAMARGVGGSGLGLYIARQIAEQMGGSLSVSSTPGAGSTFTVALPRREPAPTDA